MADAKVSALAAVTVIGATDDLYVAVSGVSNRITGANAKIAFCPPYAKVSDQKAQNTSGGTFNSGSWQQRDLNTEDSDVDGILTVASNQITLLAGTYECRIRCPNYSVDRNQARLQNVTDATTVLTGASNYTSGAGGDALITGKFTIAASKTLQVQHRCLSGRSGNGLGVECNLTTEIYTEAEFWKVG